MCLALLASPAGALFIVRNCPTGMGKQKLQGSRILFLGSHNGLIDRKEGRKEDEQKFVTTTTVQSWVVALIISPAPDAKSQCGPLSLALVSAYHSTC